MQTAKKLQLTGWAIFLFYYFAAKYFVGGFTGFSITYLVSVIILVLLTAVVPFYISQWLTRSSKANLKIIAALVAPIGLTMLGLSLYFVAFIAPNFPNITLPSILHRAIEPAIAISVLMVIPVLAEIFQGDEQTITD